MTINSIPLYPQKIDMALRYMYMVVMLNLHFGFLLLDQEEDKGRDEEAIAKDYNGSNGEASSIH